MTKSIELFIPFLLGLISSTLIPLITKKINVSREKNISYEKNKQEQFIKFNKLFCEYRLKVALLNKINLNMDKNYNLSLIFDFFKETKNISFNLSPLTIYFGENFKKPIIELICSQSMLCHKLEILIRNQKYIEEDEFKDITLFSNKSPEITTLLQNIYEKDIENKKTHDILSISDEIKEIAQISNKITEIIKKEIKD